LKPVRLLLPLLLLAAVTACKPVGEPATGAASQPAAAPAPEPAVTQPAYIGEVPTLSVTTLDGKPFDLADQRGQWVVVNYWATWCGPCLEEMPELSALDAMREHITVIGLAYEDIGADELRDFLAKRPVVYPIAIIDVTAPPASFEAPRGLPLTFLIAPDGKLAAQFVGPVNAKIIEDAIAKAGGPTPGAA
jgi:thiol-disulfide isomerase/thioredoxin